MPASDNPREISQIVPDATALKALTHPVRLRMLGMLRIDGPATATQLAQRLDLNSGATSYHLRQLAQHGFIEEDDTRGSRRDRWWRARHESTAYGQDEVDRDQDDEAEVAFTQAALSWQTTLAQRSVQEQAELPEEWRRTTDHSDYTIPLTAEQAMQLKQRVHEVLREAMQSAPPLGTPTPEGTEVYSVLLHAFPYPGRLVHRDDPDTES
ncbi:ArsR/SmtB family transcription factor [Luteipulveratus halotolerans]|uniref:ArsR family transcriptional regulator n=1 Tax=Luteipulveratus halotolerans TaxID=1631356 RepID=A0A0L6CFH4_9MICO|nr:helix-turn-helix domain-containing protein [Luteipulveratus halotolerans]KNX36571.1 ArsR family transcriptional regulator [Luteipulveratus halotolerans]